MRTVRFYRQRIRITILTLTICATIISVTVGRPLHAELLRKALKNAVTGYEKGSSKACIVAQFKETTASEFYPDGVSPITLMRRYKPFTTEFSCEAGHDFGAQGSACGHDGCGENRTIRSMRIPLD